MNRQKQAENEGENVIVSQETISVLYELIAKAFENNRYADRRVSVLNTKFAMNNTSKLLHKNVAHLFPAIADSIGEKTLERYNISVEYGETPSATEDYPSALAIIEEFEKQAIEYQTMLMGACKVAYDNNDIHVYADLLDILKDFGKVVEQMILLVDKAKFYGENNMMAFDYEIEKFWIL